MTPLRLSRYRAKLNKAVPRCTHQRLTRSGVEPEAVPAAGKEWQVSCGGLLFEAEALRQQMVGAVREQLRSAATRSNTLPVVEASVN